MSRTEAGVEVACVVKLIARAACWAKLELRGLTVKGEKVGTLMEEANREGEKTEVFDAEKVRADEYDMRVKEAAILE